MHYIGLSDPLLYSWIVNQLAKIFLSSSNSGHDKDKTNACNCDCSVGGIRRTRDCTEILPVLVLHLSRNQNADRVDEEAAQPEGQEAFEHPAQCAGAIDAVLGLGGHD